MAQLQLVFPFPVSTAGADVYRLSVAGLTEGNEVAFLDFLALPKRCGLSIDDVLGKPFGLVVLNGRLFAFAKYMIEKNKEVSYVFVNIIQEQDGLHSLGFHFCTT